MIICILVLAVLLIWFRDSLLFGILGICSFFMVLYVNSNDLNDFKVLKILLTCNEKTVITHKAVSLVSTVFQSIIVFLQAKYIEWILDVAKGTTKEQIVEIFVYFTMCFVAAIAVICNLIVICYIVVQSRWILRIKKSFRRIPQTMREGLPSRKAENIHDPILFIKDSLYKALQSLILQIYIPSRMILCLVVDFVHLLLRGLAVTLKRDDNSVGTAKVIWNILSWSLVLAISFVYFVMVICGDYSSKIMSCYSFVVGIVIIPIIIANGLNIRQR